ncbi:MAG TPA: MFS transporter [Noviherbaspirillum sp.]|jgi:MFS family permease|uniref:MFS transporter n=1 Tax=Noviherbaspirillum sp. TaxID=1926288 RepID=UPI002F924CDE
MQLLQLILIALTAHTALAGARVTTSLYALSLHASEFTVGILIALFALFPMLLAVKAGRLVDRAGIRGPMLGGAIAVAAGCALPGLVPGLSMLHVAALLVGTGFMVIQVAAQHTVGAISSDDRRVANFSWLALGFSISGFCGPVIAGFVIDHARFASAYLVFAVAGACAFMLCATAGIRVGNGARGSGPTSKQHVFQLLRDPELMRVYIVGTLLSSAWELFTFVMPIHGTRIGFSASTIGLILGCFSVATFVVRLAMPWLSRRHGEWRILAVALAMAAVAYALIPLMRQAATLAVVAAGLGLAVGASQPNMLALLHRHAPEGRGAEAVGLRVMIGNACQVFLPLAFGGAGAALGLAPVFWGMSALIGAGVPLARARERATQGTG